MKIYKPRLRAGTLIMSRYEILSEIGQGGMQQVYLALDQSLKREVALKVPIGQSAEKRFENSARLSANMVHPNIAKTLDYAVADDLEFLVEELIPGSDLQHRLDKDIVILDPHIIAHLIHHLAKAVAAMNDLGIIHRDLKPSNIMVSTDAGMIDMKVTDFGVATMADTEIKEAVEGGQQSIAASKTVVGALAFMAPELIKRNPNADRSKCDVWSIGSLLYFLLFGAYPFGNELAAIQNILNGKYIDRKTEVSQCKIQFKSLYTSLWQIVTSCLVMDPKARPKASEVVKLFSKVTYSSGSRSRGRIKFLKSSGGSWGYIGPDDGTDDVFFHFDSFLGGNPTIGQRVMFAAFPGEPRSRAFPVVPCK